MRDLALEKGSSRRTQSAVVPLRVLPTRNAADRAEGFTDLADGSSVMVVYDTPHPDRLRDGATVLADVVRL